MKVESNIGIENKIRIENENYKLVISYGWEADRIILEVWGKEGDYPHLMESHCVWFGHDNYPEDWIGELKQLYRCKAVLRGSYPRLWESSIDLEQINETTRVFSYGAYGFTWQQLAEAIKTELDKSDAPVFTANNGKKYKFIDRKMEEVE